MSIAEIVVIGAGPYGLSAAANLRMRDANLRIFGRPMEMWTHRMPRGMLLKSDGFATNLGGLDLTLEKFCRNTGRPYGHLVHRTPVADVIAYGNAVQHEYVGQVEDHRVVHVDTHQTSNGGHGFNVTLDTGEVVTCKRVVTATGLMGLERMPAIEGLPSNRLTHASDHNDLSVFAGQDITIIGAGQAAFETAALLHEQQARSVTVLSRRTPLWYEDDDERERSLWQRLRSPNFGMGSGYESWFWSEAPNLYHTMLPDRVKLAKAYTTYGPACSNWLRPRVQNVAGIECLTGSIATAEPGSNNRVDLDVRLADGGSRRIETDHVIAATGFQADLRKLDFLKPLLKQVGARMQWLGEGLPRLNRRFETSIPGWHVLGYPSAASMGPSMRFIHGTNKAAPQLADGLGYTRKTSALVRPVLRTSPG